MKGFGIRGRVGVPTRRSKLSKHLLAVRAKGDARNVEVAEVVDVFRFLDAPQDK